MYLVRIPKIKEVNPIPVSLFVDLLAQRTSMLSALSPEEIADYAITIDDIVAEMVEGESWICQFTGADYPRHSYVGADKTPEQYLIDLGENPLDYTITKYSDWAVSVDGQNVELAIQERRWATEELDTTTEEIILHNTNSPERTHTRQEWIAYKTALVNYKELDDTDILVTPRPVAPTYADALAEAIDSKQKELTDYYLALIAVDGYVTTYPEVQLQRDLYNNATHQNPNINLGRMFDNYLVSAVELVFIDGLPNVPAVDAYDVVTDPGWV